MARGQRDYGMYAPTTVISSLSDMAELAVRLGSIVSYDRRGNVLYFDDFQGTVLKWKVATIGDSYARLDSTSARSGAQSVKLQAGAGSGNVATLQRTSYSYGSRRLGVECHVSRPLNEAELRIYLYAYTATDHHRALLTINFDTGIITLTYGDSDTVDIVTGQYWANEYFSYNPVKLVVDFETGYYVRLIYNDVEYDLSNYAIPLISGGIYPFDMLVLWLHNNSDVDECTLWIDDVILTQDEP